MKKVDLPEIHGSQLPGKLMNPFGSFGDFSTPRYQPLFVRYHGDFIYSAFFDTYTLLLLRSARKIRASKLFLFRFVAFKSIERNILQS